MAQYRIGVDTGGTFTDVVVLDEKGALTTGKALSTPPTFTEGMMNALNVTAQSLGTTIEGMLGKTDLLILGTPLPQIP